jgi:hypothetical protein
MTLLQRIRKASIGSMLLGVTIATPVAADCVYRWYDNFRDGWTCCGETTCCTTIWSASVLISQRCYAKQT